jgi:RNA polymerase sigma-70 factor (ECF subfamily)
VRRVARIELPSSPQGETRSDAELLARLAQGDLGALGAIYDRYHRDVWRILGRRMSGSGEIDDLVQATFLELLRLAPSFDAGRSCRGWLCAIAVRLASRRRRSFSRLLRRLASLTELPKVGAGPDPEAIASARQELRVLDRALGKLSAKKRDAFVLVDVEGLSIDEAAFALEVPSATVRTRLFHARAELRAAMKREGAW